MKRPPPAVLYHNISGSVPLPPVIVKPSSTVSAEVASSPPVTMLMDAPVAAVSVVTFALMSREAMVSVSVPAKPP